MSNAPKYPPPGQAGGVPIEGTDFRAGWAAEAEDKPRRKWRKRATAENPAAKIARRAEAKGLIRLRLD
jgi:hypothetical protein